MAKPSETMAAVYQWLGLEHHKINPGKLTVRGHESGSHYRRKYLHRQHTMVAPRSAIKSPRG